jgi:hypothetical protein
MVYKKMQEYNTKHNAKHVSKPTPELAEPIEVEVPAQVEIVAEPIVMNTVAPKQKRKYTRKPVPAAVVVESKKEFSLLWGMIKFQY